MPPTQPIEPQPVATRSEPLGRSLDTAEVRPATAARATRCRALARSYVR
jgi:hypothetical protein